MANIANITKNSGIPHAEHVGVSSLKVSAVITVFFLFLLFWRREI